MTRNSGRGRGSGGGGGGRNRQPLTREVKISKSLAYLLRHQAKNEGVAMDEGGWANVRDVLNWSQLKSLNVQFSELQSIVASNDKKRFTLKPLPEESLIASSTRPTSPTSPPLGPTSPNDPSRYLIRAAQGHSIADLDNNQLLTPILSTDIDCPVIVVHGTYRDRWQKIVETGGLKRMSRREIHFAADEPTPLPPLVQGDDRKNYVGRYEDLVISGMRRDANICVWVDVKGSMKAGVKWWRGDNGVILTEGMDGTLGLQWVVWAELRGGGGVLFGDREKGLKMKEMQGKMPRVEGPDLRAINGVNDLKIGEEATQVVSAGGVKDGVREALRDNWDDSTDVSPER